ncbi:peptidase M50 [Thermincola ferriacetica]|uniref:Peptidase M50 n=2 Tax=Thermincola TaxID=278993 RepID=D5X7B8_THEPJ|nr:MULTISPECIES: site-2 protease family protein [Thermincola]ADG82488.1 peptidase M50 [Thermincola potens JR]KNZ70800.1 peptidase M50 [Thermincola ferriacetica]
MTSIDILTKTIEVLAIIPALTVHEYSHARVAYAFGDPTAKFQGRLTLNPIKHLDPLGTLLLILYRFGWAKPVPVNPYNMQGDRRKNMMWVSLAGPASNLLFAVVAAFLWGIFADIWYLAVFFNTLFQINLVLAVFNLVPVPPLDGSKILAGLLPARQSYIIYNLERYGPVILLLLVVFNFVGAIIGPPINLLYNLITSFVGLFFPGVFY